MPRKQTVKRADTDRKGQYKTRNWATIVYPDSAPDCWRDILRGWCCQALVSPLHDADCDPDGTPKKAHWHVLVMWDGPKSGKLMESRFAEIGGVGAQACNSARGYARYLCHLDNPEKHQYRLEEVEEFGGADYSEVIALETDRRKHICEMMDWCSETGCISFRELCDYARRNREDWFRSLTTNSTMIMYRYLRSMEHERDLAARAVPAIPKEEHARIAAQAKAASEAARARDTAREIEDAEKALDAAAKRRARAYASARRSGGGLVPAPDGMTFCASVHLEDVHESGDPRKIFG